MMLHNRVSNAHLLLRRVVVSAPFLRPLTCHAAAEATPEAATTSVKVNEVYSGKVTKISPVMASVVLDNGVLASLHISLISKKRIGNAEEVFAVGDELKAVVVSATNDRSIQVSTKALELVPGQMKTDKQVGSVMTGTAKLRRKDGWLIALDGVAALVHRSNLDHNLERGQSVQILITGIKQQSAVALATARFEKKPDGTYQPLPRLRPKLTETKAATKPAIEPASKA